MLTITWKKFHGTRISEDPKCRREKAFANIFEIDEHFLSLFLDSDEEMCPLLKYEDGAITDEVLDRSCLNVSRESEKRGNQFFKQRSN